MRCVLGECFLRLLCIHQAFITMVASVRPSVCGRGWVVAKQTTTPKMLPPKAIIHFWVPVGPPPPPAPPPSVCLSSPEYKGNIAMPEYPYCHVITIQHHHHPPLALVRPSPSPSAVPLSLIPPSSSTWLSPSVHLCISCMQNISCSFEDSHGRSPTASHQDAYVWSPNLRGKVAILMFITISFNFISLASLRLLLTLTL